MADPNQAIAITLKNEGGYVNNPADSGGPTKYGITSKDFFGDISAITVEQATAFYLSKFWNPLYNSILSQDIANKLEDMGVLAGVGTAVKCLQRALNLPDNEITGFFGPITLSLINSTNSTILLAVYRHLLNTHFEAVVTTNPKDAIFLKGWENRVAS